MAHDNLALTRLLYEELWNRGNMAAADELLAVDLIDHTPLSWGGQGVEAFKELAAAARMAFPDLYISVDDLIAQGDEVVCRWTAEGTNTGPLLGLAPTGKRITAEGIDILRMEGGKIAEHWGKIDAVGLMQQLGMIPQLQAVQA